MNILLVANYEPDRQISMKRFATLLGRSLEERGHNVMLIAPEAILLPRIRRLAGIGKWLGYIDKYLLFPPKLRRAARPFDVVLICDHSNAMYASVLRRHAHVVTCHDVIAIRAARGLEAGWHVRVTGRLLQRWILRSLVKAQHIACVSDHTRRQLIELAPDIVGRTSIIHNGLNFDFRPSDPTTTESTLAQYSLAGAPYFIHVGSNLARKNRLHVVRTFHAMRSLRPAMPHRLVFVGAGLDDDLRAEVGALDLERDVVGLGTVENDHLRDLYSAATALIFPSLSEGFGWPIIEAQACGCPAFVSNRPPMSEIGGDAAIGIDVLDFMAAARTILAELDRLPARRALSVSNAGRFSASAMIDGYAALMERLVLARDARATARRAPVDA